MPTFNTLPDAVARWTVLRTSARWEKKVATTLHLAEVPVFLPTMTRVVQYAGKRQMSDIPIFAGYVFCSETSFLDNPRVPAACRKQIAQVLKPGDAEMLRAELGRIAAVTSKHDLIQERVYGSPGDTVRIVSGPLSGLQGTVLSLKPKKRVLVLEVSFLNARLEVEVEEHQIQKE